MSVPMTLSDLERRDAKGHLISVITLVPSDLKLGHFNTWGLGSSVLLEGQSRPKQQGPSAPQFCGSALFMPTPSDAEWPNSAWWNVWGGGCIRGVPRHYILDKCVARADFLVDSFGTSNNVTTSYSVF